MRGYEADADDAARSRAAQQEGQHVDTVLSAPDRICDARLTTG